VYTTDIDLVGKKKPEMLQAEKRNQSNQINETKQLSLFYVVRIILNFFNKQEITIHNTRIQLSMQSPTL